MKRKVGILGGTFNPVHLGHLLLARAAREQLRLDEVRFLPCAQPPHKAAPSLASARDRLEMLRLAVRGEAGLSVDDREIRRGAPSYTVTTLTELREAEPATEWFFIIGADSLPDLPRWWQSDRLAQLCVFVVAARPGYKTGPVPDRFRCQVLLDCQWAVASREIRARRAAGQSIRYLVPDAVLRYIQRHNLYHRKETQSSKRVC